MTRPDHDRLEDLTLLEAGHETGFWDEHGRPAPWPDDIDEWRPTTSELLNPEPGQQRF